MVYSFVWGREIEGALAALGVTSIVVGLALQEPLGNLFSGLMLLMERPFEVGETIEVGSVSGNLASSSDARSFGWADNFYEILGQPIPEAPRNR